MEDIDAAFLLAERGCAGADVHDQRVLGLRQIGDGEEIVGLEIGDDEASPSLQHLLGLGHDVAVLGNDGLDQVEGVADEAPAWLASLSISRAPWMPLSVIGFSA